MPKRQRGAARRKSPDVGIPDSQAKKVYEWQWKWAEFNRNHKLSKKDIHKRLNWACKKLKMAPPRRLRIRLLKRGSYSYFDPDQYELGFLPQHRNVPTVLHEITHYITFRIYGKTVADHGPEFMGTFLFLLESAGQWPVGVVYHSAREYGLEIDGASPKRVQHHFRQK